MSLKFKEDDNVVVIKVGNEYKDCLGAIGRIVSVDEEWAFPYEVRFYNEDLRERQEMGDMQDLFAEDEIEFKEAFKPVAKPVLPDMSCFKPVSIEDEIRRLVERIKNEFPSSRPASVAVTKLDEARLWLGEARDETNNG